ncbi:hypothetical protein M8C21_029451 [Ambrosia artemisiifolia]|uniref:Uncharacterized protein n=1 Tax=Ambrosia artemisiifolia TaxID=4212 RepID=A0AAD5D5Q6_AMBAR|nr:hypothetical protein M8C21_029451 [Ambrosia artemisiifolia]
MITIFIYRSNSAAAVPELQPASPFSPLLPPPKPTTTSQSQGAFTFGLGTWQIFRRQDKFRCVSELSSPSVIPISSFIMLNNISSSHHKNEDHTSGESRRFSQGVPKRVS